MISTHVLDTTRGCPGSNILVILEKKNFKTNEWEDLKKDKTNSDGRIHFDISKDAGDYRLTFKIEDYYQTKSHFFLNPQIAFHITDTDRKYHVPIIINPYGYSTYRGS